MRASTPAFDPYTRLNRTAGRPLELNVTQLRCVSCHDRRNGEPARLLQLNNVLHADKDHLPCLV